MIEDTRKGMGLWVLAGLLVLAVLGVGVWGAVHLSALNMAPGWYASMEGVEIEPVQPEGAEEGYEYYRLRFVLTNNSDQDIFIAGWNLGVAPAKGDRYAVDVWESWDENVTMETEPCVPVGCIGDVELILEVNPEEMEGKTVQITLDPYGEMPLKLGEVELP